MKCKHCRSQLEEWLDGGMAADERAALEGHLDSCPACGLYLARRRAMGAALKKTMRELGSGLHFQPRPLLWRPVEERPELRRPWLGLPAITALAAVLIVALLFLFHPWAKPPRASRAEEPPARVIMVSDSLNITDEAFITGCYDGICYSIDMQFSEMTINDHS